MSNNVFASLYLFLGVLFCLVIHPVCRLEVSNESLTKTGSHVFNLKNNEEKKSTKGGVCFTATRYITEKRDSNLLVSCIFSVTCLAGDAKELTHFSQRVGHGVPSCCDQALFHRLVLHVVNLPQSFGQHFRRKIARHAYV